MTTTGQIIRWSTAGAVAGVAAVAAVASYEHACALVRAHGETGWIGRLVPLTVDGLIYASSMVMLDSARREVPVPALARWLPGSPVTGYPARSMYPELYPGRVRCGYGLPRCSPPVWRPAAFPRSGLSAHGCMWGNRARSRYACISPHSVTGVSVSLAI